ncbi:MAG: hypothetical protein RMM06_10355, partial [Armatimonadota bacterium]|nr:hypothetical protein [Armatimonadota bacterium]
VATERDPPNWRLVATERDPPNWRRSRRAHPSRDCLEGCALSHPQTHDEARASTHSEGEAPAKPSPCHAERGRSIS